MENREPNKQISDSIEEGKKVFESEVDEWTDVIENAPNPEARKLAIRGLATISLFERGLLLYENEMNLLKGEGSINEAAKVEELIKLRHKQINIIRSDSGLPPKYTESVD